MSDAGGTPTANGTANEAAQARAEQAAADLKRAQEAGWNNPIPFNYDTVVGGEADTPSAPAGATWLSDAAVYEWTDEYGTVGKKNENLERELFEDPDIQRAGTFINMLETFNVTVEGKEKVQPVRSVS
jgi:ATP-dependent RNA helicase DDX3X